ncbi:MAG: aminoacyl-histidine dipeptidase [Flavobacteriales bacterium]
MEVDQLEPKGIWENFCRLNAIPRASKREARVTAFVKAFAERLHLKVAVDRVGNVVIDKPATAGMQDRQTVVLQSHLDMVHQKNQDTEFDFDTDGIRMYVDGDWVKARGTTLGADNGIGVSAIVALLAATSIPHPPLVALFTVDEETGMTGAKELERQYVCGDILLNLDTERDTQLAVGCAGGIDSTVVGSYREEACPQGYRTFTLYVKGLRGGHSGMDIHKGLGNSNKIMNRLLFAAQREAAIRIVAIDGGGLRNAIPRESTARFAVPSDRVKKLESCLQALSSLIRAALSRSDSGMEISWESADQAESVMHSADQKKLLHALYACYNGVYRMSNTIAGLVETSSNLARVHVCDGKIQIGTLQRSASESAKADMAQTLASAFELAGYSVRRSGSYPGWQVNPDSPIRKLCQSVYTELFGAEPEVVAEHGGLECGLLLDRFPTMDAVSFGPNILGAHSPDERVQISSVQKFWKFLSAVLQAIPKRD